MNNHPPESVLDLIQHVHYSASYTDYGGVTAIKMYQKYVETISYL